MDLSERKERFVEAVNIRVMEEFVKIVNLPIAMKKNFDLVIEDVLHFLEYDKKDDKFPLTWPKPSGFGSTTFAISVKSTYCFWKWFTTVGKENLKKYNNRNNTNIMLIQEKTIRQTDINRLCLLVRLQIKECYERANKKFPDVRIRKNNKIDFPGLGEFDPIIMVRRLNWKLPKWNGTPLNELMDIRLRKEEETGKLVLGELSLPGLTAEEQKEFEDVPNQGNKENWTEVVKKHKRRTSDEATNPKKSRKDMPSTSTSR
ncbi:unnamed protein product [Cylicocyclus nassatus]|uniref:Uncharacterized protein n=1 Tax=Cylicocyclus nassatus TaxID=53992 RepID=A0AA36MBA0_CYLNA|nr:unnamed protein product [Cylicocyclus nassatus]